MAESASDHKGLKGGMDSVIERYIAEVTGYESP